jgi:acetyl esterase/lipase
LNDCLLAYNTLLEKYDPAQIVVAGISAGGSLVLSMLLALKEKGIPMPSAAVTMSPAVDLLFEGESMKYNGPNDWILPERLANLRDQYLGDKNPKEPLVSPIYGNLAGLPPIMVQVGTHELLLDDVRRFVSKLKSQGGVVKYREWEGMFHCWHIFASEVLEGREAISAIGEFTRNIWNH